jgi:NAD(P)-dependent dehydrogenase (short-subunit alcohol dehydrogenase family)
MTMPALHDRVAVVTGSTSGIGKGIAQHFASVGARVVIHGREKEVAGGIVAQIAESGGIADAFIGDLIDPETCRAVVRFAVERFGRIDVLVNNAADTSRGDVESTSLELWERIMAVNLRAPFLCMQEAVRHMKARRAGSVVNIGSINAYIGQTMLHPYSVSKGGLMTMTRNAASHLGQYRIRVNQINVGWTLTEGERVVMRREGRPENWVDDAVRTRPFGRLLLPRDIALAAAYFASDDSECVSGSVLDLEQFPVGALPIW